MAKLKSQVGDNLPCELGRNRLVSWERQTQGKDRALVDLACDRNRSAVGLRDFLYDGQPESGAAGIFRPCPIGPIKPLEEMRKMFRRESVGIPSVFLGRLRATVVPCSFINPIPSITKARRFALDGKDHPIVTGGSQIAGAPGFDRPGFVRR